MTTLSSLFIVLRSFIYRRHSSSARCGAPASASLSPRLQIRVILKVDFTLRPGEKMIEGLNVELLFRILDGLA